MKINERKEGGPGAQPHLKVVIYEVKMTDRVRDIKLTQEVTTVKQ